MIIPIDSSCYSPFVPIEETLISALDGLSEYYTTNQLSANPTKTQVSLFHLRNRECDKQLNIRWNDVNLTHSNLPVYIGITLQRTYRENRKESRNKKQHHLQTKNLKVGSHSKKTFRSSALALYATQLQSTLARGGTLHPCK